MKTITANIRKVHAAVWMVSALMLCACSADLTNTTTPPEEDEAAVVDAIDVSGEATRALGMSLDEFSVSVYNVKTGKLIVDGAHYVSNGTGFTSTPAWRMVATEMKAIGVSPTMSILESVTVNADDAYYDYTVPTTEQTMLKIGANLSFTKKSVNNFLYLKFVNALSLFTIKARNELKVEETVGTGVDAQTVEHDVTIYVKGITLHNLQAKGRFTYTGDKTGTWTPSNDTYYNYTQEFPEKIQLNTKTYVDVMDSVFVLLPQSPESNAWAPAGTDDAPESDAISVANTNHQVYIELRCSMTIERDGQTVYVWGGENSYQPVYFPYIKKYCPKAWNAINRQGTYNLHFVKGEALTSEGKPIKPQTEEEGDSFENAVFITVSPTDNGDNDNVDDWEDPQETVVNL